MMQEIMNVKQHNYKKYSAISPNTQFIHRHVNKKRIRLFITPTQINNLIFLQANFSIFPRNTYKSCLLFTLGRKKVKVLRNDEPYI